MNAYGLAWCVYVAPQTDFSALENDLCRMVSMCLCVCVHFPMTLTAQNA